MKRMLVVSMVLLALLTVGMPFPSAVAAEKVSDKRVVLVLPGGLGDRSFIDSAHRGLVWAAERLGVETKYIEPSGPEDFEFLIRTSAMSGADLVITVYFTMLDATNTVADEFPHVQFAIIDAVSDRPNVTSLVFEEHVGSYLVGVMAGMLTKVDKVGFVGGEEIPNIRRFEKGFVAGVKAVNADAQILSGYTGSFEDPGKGKEVALSHYDRGADIVFHAAGKTGEGVISAAKQTGQYVIGVDSDQCYIAPDNMIASMMKMVDVAVFNTIESVVKGEFQPGATNVFGLEARAIGPCRLYPDILNLDEHVDFSGMDEAMEAVQEYRLKILEGEIIVPDAYEDE